MGNFMYGPEVADDDEADRLYQQFKLDYAGLDPATQAVLLKKVIWFLSWRGSATARDEVQTMLESYFPRNGGLALAHVHRPYWIRKIGEGDAYDRGERVERYEAPL